MAEVEVVVEEAKEEPEQTPLLDATHKVFLASIGAMALAQEAMVDCVTKLVERGEIVEREGGKLVRERMERRRHQVRKVVKRGEKEGEEAQDELDTHIEELLNRMNVPTKKDIDALSAKITALTKKVDELKEA